MPNHFPYFNDNPQASDIVLANTPDLGPHVAISSPASGTIRIPTTATYCVRTCPTACTSQSFTIDFADIDFGDCNACGKTLTVTFYQRKDVIYNVGNFRDDLSIFPWSYQGLMSGVVTGATLATAFINEMRRLKDQGGHDLYGAILTQVGAEVLVVIPCPNKLRNIIAGNPTSLLPTELPVVTPVTTGTDANLTRLELLQRYPSMGIQPLPGTVPPPSFTWCYDACIVVIKGCFSACPPNALNTSLDATGLTAATITMEEELVLNSGAAGFSAFLTQLNSLVAGCAVATAAPIPITPFTPVAVVDGTVTGTPGTETLTLTPASITIGDRWVVQTSNGVQTPVTAAIGAATGVAIAAALTAVFPAGTFVGNATQVTFTGTIAGLAGTAINLVRVTVP